jgi:hypothetical protein
MRGRRALVPLLVLATCSCGYRLLRFDLPPDAGGCVRVRGIDGGESHPQLAHWVEATLRTRLAADACAAGEEGAVLAGTVEWVREDQTLLTVDERGGEYAGGTWVAAATIRLERQGRVGWGPEGVEVSRELVSTGSAMLEADAVESHLRLLGEKLGEALVDLLYGRTGAPPIGAGAIVPIPL